MDPVSATRTWSLFILTFAFAMTENTLLTTSISPTAMSGLNPATHSPNSDLKATALTNLTEEETGPGEGLTSSTIAEPTGNTGHSQPSTTLTPMSDGTTQRKSTASIELRTSTAQETQTTANDKTTMITTHSLNSVTTSHSGKATNKGIGLNNSERTITILFSLVLGVSVVALVVFMLLKCKHKMQYMHQPLTNANDTADMFVEDGNTLVISRGLYVGHPIYDNVPPPPSDQSQFRLDFLH